MAKDLACPDLKDKISFLKSWINNISTAIVKKKIVVGCIYGMPQFKYPRVTSTINSKFGA